MSNQSDPCQCCGGHNPFWLKPIS